METQAYSSLQLVIISLYILNIVTPVVLVFYSVFKALSFGLSEEKDNTSVLIVKKKFIIVFFISFAWCCVTLSLSWYVEKFIHALN